MNRRSFLVGAAALSATACRTPPEPSRTVLGLTDMALGHRVRTPFRPSAASPTTRVPVLIVGGGVAGLSAAWRLRRGGFTGDLPLLELGDQLGGTAGGTGPAGRRCPLGAHYVTLPNPENRPVRRMLQDFGVITELRDGRPVYREDMLCAAPEERLYFGGFWEDGLLPHSAPAEDRRQHEAFGAEVARWTAHRGADGRPAFSIPVACSSADPEILALTQASFAAWLDQRGFTAPFFRWWLAYGMADDYGTTLEETSAWAGLHYHCARRPDPAEELGTEILTWPDGNGWLVDQLAAAAGVTPTLRAVARAVTPTSDGVRVDVEVGGAERVWIAEQVVLAVPSAVASLLIGQTPVRSRTTPWEVVNLFVAAAPTPRLGAALAWDNVVYGSDSLGYVHGGHQIRRRGGPTVLTWYRPWLGEATPTRTRFALETGEGAYLRASEELLRLHPELRIESATIQLWGHGTVRPEVGMVPTAQGIPSPDPRIHLAHTDRSGMSLFEEAAWHGVAAAEAILAARGPLGDEVLATVSF